MSRESLGTILGDTLSRGFSISLVPMPYRDQARVEVSMGDKVMAVECGMHNFDSAIGMLIKGLRTAIGPMENDAENLEE